MDETGPDTSGEQKKPKSPSLLVTAKETLDDTMAVAETAREVSGYGRVARIAATLGIFFALLIGLLSVQHLDTALTIAAFAVALALPPLVVASAVTAFDFTPKPGAPMFVVKMMDFTSAVFLEVIGAFLEALAVVMVLWHLAPVTAVALLAGVGIVMASCLSALGIILLNLWRVDRKAKAHGKSVSPKELWHQSRFLSWFLEPYDKEKQAQAQRGEWD
jgi:hypothetical protein